MRYEKDPFPFINHIMQLNADAANPTGQYIYSQQYSRFGAGYFAPGYPGCQCQHGPGYHPVPDKCRGGEFI
jgi:hypothetical protein